MFRKYAFILSILGSTVCASAQYQQVTIGGMMAVPLGYSTEWLSLGGGLSAAFERPISKRTTVDFTIGYARMGVASKADQILANVAYVPYDVGFKIYTGRDIQSGPYVKLHLGYMMFIASSEEKQIIPITSGLPDGSLYVWQGGVGGGYMWEHLDITLQHYLIDNYSGVKGFGPHQILELRVAYQFNWDA